MEGESEVHTCMYRINYYTEDWLREIVCVCNGQPRGSVVHRVDQYSVHLYVTPGTKR